MKKTILPSHINGTLPMQPSKSVLHRALICAALAEGESVLANFAWSDDIAATLCALRDMGLCGYRVEDGVCYIRGGLRQKSKPVIDCKESGSTLRFLLPLATDGQERVFTGQGRLLERPMAPYEALFAAKGILLEKQSGGIKIKGRMRAGLYELAGDVSSQFITGLLFLLPTLGGDSRLCITTALESKPYVDLTCQTQMLFGVETCADGRQFIIEGAQKYRAGVLCVEGDYSHAAFFAVAAAMGGTVLLQGLNPQSLQGDKQILGILQCMGAEIRWEANGVAIAHRALKPLEMDVAQIPDLVPALAVLACAAKGRTRIYNAGRLRYKESDRLHAMAQELEKLGADIVEYEDSMVINGTGRLSGGLVHTHGDHRVAMALSIASVIAEEPVILDQPDVVTKSAPRFYEEFSAVGGLYR